MSDVTVTCCNAAQLSERTRSALVDLAKTAARHVELRVETIPGRDDRYYSLAELLHGGDHERSDVGDADWGSTPLQSRINARAALRRMRR